MNILYCGDKNIEDGLIISILSLMGYSAEPLHVYILTAALDFETARCEPVTDTVVDFLNALLNNRDGGSVRKIDVTEHFMACLPEKNLGTRFTPCCMLRLFADQVEEIPDRILYLDADVVCRKNIRDFYHQDMSGWELAGVLDHYGKWFFRRDFFHWDYINSGVLLLNMAEIRRTGLFQRCRERCRDKKMFMPDQSAINKLADKKKLWDRRYNEQRRLREDTVLQHFTTSFRAIPPRIVTVKPWQADRVHNVLKIHEYDPILDRYQQIRRELDLKTETRTI